jgi:hypothetical protein
MALPVLKDPFVDLEFRLASSGPFFVGDEVRVDVFAVSDAKPEPADLHRWLNRVELAFKWDKDALECVAIECDRSDMKFGSFLIPPPLDHLYRYGQLVESDDAPIHRQAVNDGDFNIIFFGGDYQGSDFGLEWGGNVNVPDHWGAATRFPTPNGRRFVTLVFKVLTPGKTVVSFITDEEDASTRTSGAPKGTSVWARHPSNLRIDRDLKAVTIDAVEEIEPLPDPPEVETPTVQDMLNKVLVWAKSESLDTEPEFYMLVSDLLEIIDVLHPDYRGGEG